MVPQTVRIGRASCRRLRYALALGFVDLLPVVGSSLGDQPKNGLVALPGLVGWRAQRVSMAPSLGLPPGVEIGSLPPPVYLVIVPGPGLG